MMQRFTILIVIVLVLVGSQIAPSRTLSAQNVPDHPFDAAALIEQEGDAVIPDGIDERYAALVKRGYTTGRTPDGLPAIGSPYAPFTIEQISSFSCTHCANFTANYFNNLLDKILEGKVRYVFIPLTQIGSFDSEPMARAALCAGEQGKFWQMHDVMFDWLDRYGAQANNTTRLSSAAEQLGLNVKKFNTCIKGTRAKKLLTKAQQIAVDRDVNSTPRAYLNGEQIFPGVDGAPSMTLDALLTKIDEEGGSQ
jgi:protein-disulfide isomerase